MTMTHTAVLWISRLLGAATALFFTIFALDARAGDAPGGVALFMHLLPALIVAAAVAAAWRVPALGAVAFAALAIGYAIIAANHLDWIAVIAGPLALTSVLFAVSAYLGRSAASAR